LLAINLVSAAVYSFSGHYNTRSFPLSSLQLCVHKSEEEEEPARRLGRLTDGRTGRPVSGGQGSQPVLSRNFSPRLRTSVQPARGETCENIAYCGAKFKFMGSFLI
jgi:hypothetical protein